MSSKRNVSVALTIAGSDCSSGAGLQADLKTFGAFGVFGLTAVTCVVAEVPGKVSRIEAVDRGNLADQIELCLAHFPVTAIKTGLLFSAENVATVANLLERLAPATPLVIDPVMVATSGDSLLQPEATELYRTRLLPRASLITPNLSEAAVLTGRPINNLEEMRAAGAELAQRFGTQILIKGGHLKHEDAIDLLIGVEGGVEQFSAPRISGVATHGTGCTYSAAITAVLARGAPLRQAIVQAKEFVTQAIANHFSWQSSLGEVHALNHRIPGLLTARSDPDS
jgi:hydroxymethylpyrimidine/phosphomethylpyrimidine kinase